MEQQEPITTTREIQAVLIPVGVPINIPAESVVYVTQALGGTVTVNINGNLARVAGTDLDALGMEPEEDLLAQASDNGGKVDEELVWAILRSVYDPEIPVNIVDLGLIYSCSVSDPDEGQQKVDVSMTLTAPGCGMGEFLVQDVQTRLQDIPNLEDVNVELVFDPPWNPEMMSEAARLQVGFY
jgi:probable FeS assembly SUF system protein SufT